MCSVLMKGIEFDPRDSRSVNDSTTIEMIF